MNQPQTMPDALAFADKKTDGAFPVTAEDGGVVARIVVGRWSGRSFEAETASGAPLCSGRAQGFFARTWEARDDADRLIVSVRPSSWSTSKAVVIDGQRELRIGGKVFARDWALADADGTVVLGADAQGSSLSFRPDSFVVRCYDRSLSLAHIVAVVELNRLIVKNARAAAAGG